MPKNLRLLAWCPFFAVIACVAATNAPPAPVPAPAPGTGQGLLLSLVPILTPILITVLKWGIPRVPAVVLPLLAPALGIAIDWLGTLKTGAPLSPLIAAISGAAGTGLYEIQRQVRQQIGTTPEPAKP